MTDGVTTKAGKIPGPAPASRTEGRRNSRSTTTPGRPGGAHDAIDNFTMQALMRTGAVRAKLSVSETGDADEREADRVADAAVAAPPPSMIRRKCASCEAGVPCGSCGGEDKTVRLKRAPGLAGPSATAGLPAFSFLNSGGSALPRDTRHDFEPRIGADLSEVRIHDGPAAGRAATALNAHAFTIGQDIVFAPGQFSPSTRSGRHLLAHELAHTLQPPRGAGSQKTMLRRLTACTLAGPANTDPDTEAVVKGVKDDDVAAVVGGMRGKGVIELCGLRSAVDAATSKRLERWLMSRRSQGGALASVNKASALALSLVNPSVGASLIVSTVLPGAGRDKKSAATAEEGLRLLMPALPLLDRLELYDESDREIEQAQIDVIRAASADERIAARSETARLNVIFGRMDVKEEYDARLLIDPEQKYVAAERVLARADNTLFDDEDLTFDAIWALTPGERKTFFSKHKAALQSMLSDDRMALLKTLVEGTEAQALIARLREATEDRSDDQEAIRAIVDRAVTLLNEQRQLRAVLAVATLPEKDRADAQKRLDEMGELEALVRFGSGKLEAGSFLGRLADAADSSDAFGAMTRKLGATISDPVQLRAFVLASAKQRVLKAREFRGADEDSIRNAILELRAPLPADADKLEPKARERRQDEENEKIRRELIADPEVKAVITRMRGSEQMRVLSFITADAFVDKMTDLQLALNAPRWGEFFQIVLQIAQNNDWRTRFENTKNDPFGTYARVFGEARVVMLEILKTQRMPTDKVLAFTGDVDVLRAALASMDEDERGTLRLGYLLSRQKRTPATEAETKALQAYQAFEAKLRKSQTTIGVTDKAGIETVLDAALGSEPTKAEIDSPEGRFNAAAIMYERQQSRLGLEMGASAAFTETDETMQAAGREFAARWLQLRERTPHTLSMLEFAALAALHDRFNTRSQEFVEASNTAGEIAGMIAATVAGIIIVAATGGVTAPAVIAAAAAGAASRVVTREMFGADYYSPASATGGRDALLGAIDAALAVVGASLGAKGAQMLGLGGRALLTNAARVGGEVAEQASAKLLHRVGAKAVEAAIDGAFSGFVSEAANAMTDARTWRNGIWNGLVRTGQAALIGGLAGLAAGGVVGAALPVIGAGFRGVADRVLGASIETTLAKAGAAETLDAARVAVRKGEMDEAQKLFAQLEKHLSPEQANLLWRDLSHLAEAATRLEEPIVLAGQKHTLKLVDGPDGAFFVLCSWCTRVHDILKASLGRVAEDSAQAKRIAQMIAQVEKMEAKGLKDVNTMRSLLGILSEGEHLIGAELKALPSSVPKSFSELAKDPAVARRAEELYQGYYEQLYAARRDIFRGKDVKKSLQEALAEEAQARALDQARREIAGAPLELKPGQAARTAVDQASDFPFGFYDRAGFERFSKTLHEALGISDAKFVLEGSAVTGRRLPRAPVEPTHTGQPFGFARMSDLDVAIYSDTLVNAAKNAKPPINLAMPLSSADLARMKLGKFELAAHKAALEATGIAHPVNFKLRPNVQSGDAPAAALGLNLPK